MAHVLIIEDDPDVVELLSHHLHKRGHQISIAFDGGDGYRSAALSVPDLVVLDLILPAINGNHVLDLLRDNPHTRSISVILISGYRTLGRLRPATLAKADDFVAKPFRLSHLLQRIDRLLAA